MKLGELRSDAIEAAEGERISKREIDMLLAHALDRSTTWVFAHEDHELSHDEESAARVAINRRLKGEPVQYIRGKTEFYGHEFLVDDRALIPRPETELLVEGVLKMAPGAERIFDACTGSGCVAIAVSLHSRAKVWASDVSLEALALARSNAVRLGAPVTFIAADVLEPVRGSFDVITANPPYISGFEMTGLQREVRDFEPHVALTPGTSGLEIVIRILDSAELLLRKDGLLMMELGWKQGETVREMAVERGWRFETLLDDLSSIPRHIVLRRRSGGEA